MSTGVIFDIDGVLIDVRGSYRRAIIETIAHEHDATVDQEIIDRYGSIGASPHRIDTVTFLLETRRGLWSAQLPFKPKGVSKKKRTFGQPELTLGEEMQGRFVGLLPAKAGEKDADGGLH